MSSKATLALCICTRNRPDDLRRCLQSIRDGQQLPDQVLVSDDSDIEDAVRDVVSAFPFAQYQRGPRSGLGANRNACIAAQSARYVMFVDDDVEVPPQFFHHVYALLSDRTVPRDKTIISGFEFKRIGGGFVRIEPGNADFWGYQRVPPKGHYRAIVINAAVFPAALFERAKFDPLLRYGSEEMDMTHHALSLGYSIAFDGDLFVHHYPSEINRAEYATFVEASRMYATAKAYLLYEKNPWKTLVFCLLGPSKLIVGLGRRTGWSGVKAATSATLKASGYLITLRGARAQR